MLPTHVAERLRIGMAIPAHPLALDAQGRFDERHQRALTRYYLASGAGGLAVGVHTTQFAIRRAGLFEPVLALAAETATEGAARPVLVAGACGPTAQAVAEAATAARLGYDAVLLSPGGLAHHSEAELLDRAAAVGEVLPVVGFYLQPAAGGRHLSAEFWRRLADQPSTVAVKVAPFDRYRTLDALRGVAGSSRADLVAIYTGNDDHIADDLLTPPFVGGLLGQFAVWTGPAVRLVDDARAARAGNAAAQTRVRALAPRLTDANGALFDAVNGFAGCIPGVNEILRRQGLLASTRTLDPAEVLSPGQAAELDRVVAAHPDLVDDAFVAAHLDEWLR